MEAFVAVLLIAGVLLIIIGQEHLINPDPNSDIYDSQLIALRDIQMNDTLRQFVLNAPPVESDAEGFPEDVKNRIEYLILDYLECKAKICEIESDCNLDAPEEKEIYAQGIAITATLAEYDPKQLKLFCWRK